MGDSGERAMPAKEASGRLWNPPVAESLRAGETVFRRCRWCNRELELDKRDKIVCPNCDSGDGYLSGQKPE